MGEIASEVESLPWALKLLHGIPGPCGVGPYAALFGKDRLQEGIPHPVEGVCEDAIEFISRMNLLPEKLQQGWGKLHSK